MNRRERQGAILRLIRERPISTQTELAEELHRRGHDVVQTTVSRDIAELGLVKVRSASGRLVYAESGAPHADRLRALAAAIREYALSLEPAGNLVVVKTPPGCANVLAQAMDAADHPSIAGTVAGDDTIFVAARDGVSASRLCDDLKADALEGAA